MSSSLPGRVFFCCCLPGESRGMHLRSQADGQEGSRGCCLHCPFASRCGKTPFPGKSGPAPHLARFQAAWLGGGTSLEGDPGRGALPRAHKPSSSGVLEMTQGAAGAPEGCGRAVELLNTPLGDKCHAGTRAARQSCSTTGKGEAAVKSPWRLHCGLKDGSVAAAAAKRLRQAASAPLGGHRHQTTSPPFPKQGQAGRGERALIPRSPRESARLPGEARSGRHPRLQSCRSGLGGDNAALPSPSSC